MHSYLLAAAIAVAILLVAPVAGKAVAGAFGRPSLFDPLSCAMDAGGPCSQTQMIAHRRALDAAAAATG